jgi:GNAT superfamily N-acetyltransferase
MERVEETARRVEDAQARQAASFAAAVLRLDPASGARSVAVGGGMAVYAGRGSPVSLAIGLLSEISAADLDRIEEVLGSPTQIELTPHAHPSLPRLLGERGYRVAEWHQMLARPLETQLPEGPSSVEVARIGKGDEDAWARLAGASSLEKDDVPSAGARSLLPAASAEGIACFVARVEGQSVGGAAAFLSSARAAVLSGAGVLPRYRGLGVQRALIAARLRYAKEMGADVAASSTLPNSISQKNLERFGFRILYPKAVLVRATDRP